MASSSKTANLGLNNWAASDRPKRSDFVSDNTIIDSKVGGHINNAQIHLSPDERDKLEQSTRVVQYQGTGAQSRDITLPFEPAFVIVYKKGEPPASYSSNYATVNTAFAAAESSVTGGVTLDGTTLTVTQSTSASNGVFYNLNKQYSQYIIFLIH